MIVLYLQYITRVDIQNNRSALFIFGDNDKRAGFGGQAEQMRANINSIGIRVKKAPGMQTRSFYTDEEYISNTKKIQEDVNEVMNRIRDKSHPVLVIPAAGIGTGYAQLPTRAPRTAKFLDDLFIQNGFRNGVL